MKYRNPILPGFYPDPSICRAGDDYYLVASTFEYFPGVPIFHSRNLADWEQIGHCLTRPSQLPLSDTSASSGVYAPTIRHHNGRFYMVTTHFPDKGHFFVYADDPTGEWSDPIWVRVGDDVASYESIDPSLFFDDDGKVYFTCNQFGKGIIQLEIDIETGERVREAQTIWTGTGGSHAEAPHLYKINGMYYLVIAEGGTHIGHMVTIARSESPYGPFEPCPHNPILTHRSTDHIIQATGHADLLQAANGSWWAVCLGIQQKWPNGFPPCHNIGRETFLAPVTWDDEGWPTVGNNGMIDLEMETDQLPGEPAPQTSAQYRDDFTLPELDMRWNFIRNPQADAWSLGNDPGYLQLNGSAVTLDDMDSPTFIGRRQQHHRLHAETRLHFDPATDNEEAGLTAYMNDRHHYEIAVTQREGQNVVIVRQHIGMLSAVVAEAPLSSDVVILAVDIDEDEYRFSYGADGEELQYLATGEMRYLSTEIAGGFTGVYLGLYATGNGQPSTTPARFDYFDYVPEEV